MHTCYSPVRRSPAGESKLSPPMPLDLHVLSLSLAFILSQDQTLRCCYIVFSFFSIKKAISLVIAFAIPCDQLRNVRPGRFIESPGRIDRDLFAGYAGSFSCTTSSKSIVNLSMFSFSPFPQKRSAKLIPIFELTKFLANF